MSLLWNIMFDTWWNFDNEHSNYWSGKESFLGFFSSINYFFPHQLSLFLKFILIFHLIICSFTFHFNSGFHFINLNLFPRPFFRSVICLFLWVILNNNVKMFLTWNLLLYIQYSCYFLWILIDYSSY